MRLSVHSLSACPDPLIALNTAKQPKKFPVTLKSKGALVIPYLVTFACANDAAKGAGHEDFSVSALVDHAPLGSGDGHPLDDVCPRTVPAGGVVDPFPNGKIVDKGCGTKKPDKTLGGPILVDVQVK